MFSREAQVKQESGQDRKKLLSLLRRLRTRHCCGAVLLSAVLL